MWWVGDRSTYGLLLTLAVCFVSTMVTQYLVYLGLYQCVCGHPAPTATSTLRSAS